MPLNFGGQKRSGAFDTVWPSATNVEHFAAWVTWESGMAGPRVASSSHCEFASNAEQLPTSTKISWRLWEWATSSELCLDLEPSAHPAILHCKLWFVWSIKSEKFQSLTIDASLQTLLSSGKYGSVLCLFISLCGLWTRPGLLCFEKNQTCAGMPWNLRRWVKTWHLHAFAMHR